MVSLALLARALGYRKAVRSSAAVVKSSECNWHIIRMNGTKYLYELTTHGCWTRKEDNTRGEWVGVYNPVTKNITSVSEIRILLDDE